MIKTTEQMDVSTLQLSLKPLREEIINHKMYSRIQTVQDVAIFMEHHVFAVWDFMSLLKSLQVKLTCTKIPWVPSDHALASRLINEIVLTEESDELPGGGYGSHFTLYRRAMIQCGADTSGIDSVVARATTGASMRESVTAQQLPVAARDFVYATCGLIESDSAITIAAALTLGREDIIPEMFKKIIFDLSDQNPKQLSVFRDYLNRHIYVDDEHHRPMSFQMLEALCQSTADWTEAEAASKTAMQARLALWDAIDRALSEKQLNF